MRFTLLSQNVWESGIQKEASFFRLDETSGTLLTKEPLDREIVCAGKLNCSIALTLITTIDKRPVHMKVCAKFKDDFILEFNFASVYQGIS